MAPSFLLNPLTTGRIERDTGGPVALELRCFARRRSFRKIRIEQSAMPRLFDALLAWLEGETCTVPQGLETGQQLALWRHGLLISPDELNRAPALDERDCGNGHGIARAICPAVGSLLDHGLQILPLPCEKDPGLAENGWCDVPPLIGTHDLHAINSYFDALCQGQWLQFDDKHSRRLVINNDPVARRIQSALAPHFSAIAGQSLKPSYTQFVTYLEQAPLPRHTDREQCEFTFSLYLNYSPQPSGDLCPWPLIIHRPEGEVAAHQRLGGGSLLKGRVLPHSRPPLPPGHEARMLFCHYVLESFDGPLD